MWTGNYYLAFADEKTGIKSDLIFSCQLDGQWMAEHHGLPGVFRPDTDRHDAGDHRAVQRPADQLRGDRLCQAGRNGVEDRRVSAGGELPALRFLPPGGR